MGFLKCILQLKERFFTVLNFLVRHAGLDPASRNGLDSGLRRNDGMSDKY